MFTLFTPLTTPGCLLPLAAHVLLRDTYLCCASFLAVGTYVVVLFGVPRPRPRRVGIKTSRSTPTTNTLSMQHNDTQLLFTLFALLSGSIYPNGPDSPDGHSYLRY